MITIGQVFGLKKNLKMICDFKIDYFSVLQS